MGCRLSKDESKIKLNGDGTSILFPTTPSEAPPSSVRAGEPASAFTNQMETTTTKGEYKARFERKMCIAKETPEPVFDLSKCNLKEIPSGVFIHCRVLRKEILNLSENQLQTINCNNNNSIGLLSDLSLLRVLDLRFNRIKQLPEEIDKLENLRELLLSNNQLEKLPQAIKTLKNLELLDVSNNNLQSIDVISCMSNLRILNVSGNQQLRTLPVTLATCDTICDLIFDPETIDWPPSHILASGTANILHFLATGERVADNKERDTHTNLFNQPEDALISDVIEANRNITPSNTSMSGSNQYQQSDESGYGNENALLEEIQRRQQEQKQQLLKAVLKQQNETETLVNKLHQQKDNERDLLIKDILHAEENANLVIDNFLVGKSNIDNALFEKERIEENRLLEKVVHLKHSELRKQEILSTMLDSLHDEQAKIHDYQKQRDATSIDIMQQESATSAQLTAFYRNYERNRNEIVARICDDEELQKQAVAALIAKVDARSWGLVEQMRIVELQLAEMTQFEIERKRYCNAEQTNQLAEKRIHLSSMLTDLLDQQELRRQQLCATLKTMEEQKSTEQQDYWLMQYQRLLDSRPKRLFGKSTSIDPRLGYNFLINGVIHCLPFLQKLLLTTDVFLEMISDEELNEAGIRDELDRRLILKSIDDFICENLVSSSKVTEAVIPTAPLSVSLDNDGMATSSSSSSSSKYRNAHSSDDATGASECVICMEEYVRVIFLPCGHMCCCFTCQLKVDTCPMCRAPIERKVKVVQP